MLGGAEWQVVATGLTNITILLAVAILILSLDDVVIDVAAIVRRLYRRFVIFRRHHPLQEEDLDRQAPQWVAVMIPAWQESEVIERMLDYCARTYLYDRYRLFVGCYQNDAATGMAAVRAAARIPHVVPVTVPRDGPTNKADCLNAIYDGIAAYEDSTGLCFEIFVLHDAEDVVHPLELKLFNFLIPRKDMVQLPVIPLERPLTNFSGGHYLDEFAEIHIKDLPVRERLMGHVPSAGVGCAFSRRAMQAVASLRNGAPFNSGSLTEDYEFALQLKYLGFTQIFVRFGVWRLSEDLSPLVARQGPWGRKRMRDRVATREYFPGTFAAACRQKARWLIGIVLQSSQATGWRGPWPLKFALYRDRKGLATAAVAVAAYVILLGWVMFWLAASVSGASYGQWLPQHSPVLNILLWANGILLLNRTVQRAVAVYVLYGPWQALVSAPRQVWGNVINFCAACRAILLFLRHRISGAPLTWDKTLHAFPTEDELRPFRARSAPQPEPETEPCVF